MKGLTSNEVLESRKKYGSNKLPEKKLKTGFEFFIETFKDKLNLILLAMMVVFTVLAVVGQGSFSEPAGIAVVLLAIAVISTNTGLKSQKSTKELRDKTSVHYCNVIRDGEVVHINTDEIVVGDVILIQSGEAIYADGYLAEGSVSVDNSVLNGESKECKKSVIDGFVYKSKEKITGDDYVDQNSLFAGATIVDGEGKMIVTNVGINTVNGKTISSMNDIEETKTSLQIQLDDLADQISKFGYAGASIIVIALFTTQIIEIGGLNAYFGLGFIPMLNDILTIITTALTIVVAAVPEGLPLIISLITAQNAKVMIKHNVLAKNTNKIPEAGNIQLLCTDKTGTLTKGILEPVHNISLNGDEIKDDTILKRFFIENVCLNSSAMYDSENKIVGGNATERALLGMTTPMIYESITKNLKVINRKSFNSAYKYSSVSVEKHDENNKLITTYYKGAPEKLLAVAKTYVDADGTIHTIDLTKVQNLIDNFTEKAMRVIATGFSNKEIGDELPDDLVITSLVAIRDDVRPEVPEAVRKMHAAGVQVMMVTGDVISTAKAIAKDAGLVKSDSDIAMSAIDFDQLSDDEAKKVLPNIKVIARATPQTKLRIVRLAQEMGLCVGMTGDGTNDAPALKAADVGFSMGSGTDVCKEAGDIIITDDNFVSITDAVMLGRTFMHNVMKFLKFQLPINVSLVIMSVLFPILLGVEAIAAVQILIINIVMDSLNSLSFGGEPAKDEYMREKPIPKGSKLLNKDTTTQIIVSVVTFLLVFGITAIPEVRNFFGTEEQYATVRFALLVVMATINGFNIRTDSYNLFEGIGKNTMFIKIAISIFAMTILLGQFGGSLVHCSALTLSHWIAIFALALITIPVDLARKYIVKNKKGHNEEVAKCQLA